jgi:hypothetical protein
MAAVSSALGPAVEETPRLMGLVSLLAREVVKRAD